MRQPENIKNYSIPRTGSSGPFVSLHAHMRRRELYIIVPEPSDAIFSVVN